jgi:hypothetical protein
MIWDAFAIIGIWSAVAVVWCVGSWLYGVVKGDDF